MIVWVTCWNARGGGGERKGGSERGRSVEGVSHLRVNMYVKVATERKKMACGFCCARANMIRGSANVVRLNCLFRMYGSNSSRGNKDVCF